jgi:hypothetical protein
VQDLSKTPQETQSTHSIPDQLAQPLALFRLRIPQVHQLLRQLSIGNQDIPMNSQENTHDRLNSFEITMRSKTANEACEEE